MTVKERLAKYLKERGISQRSFEQQVGFSNGYVNNIRRSISPDKLLSISTFDPQLNTEWLITGIGSMFRNEDTGLPENKRKDSGSKTGIPYYVDVNASAGLDFLTDHNGHYSVPISIPNLRADAFINVFGDSMYPKYCSGEIIGIKETQKDMVMFGHAYVVQMSDGEAYLKYVKKGRDDDHWLLDNENGKYEPREFHLSKIYKIFIIKAVISKTTLL